MATPQQIAHAPFEPIREPPRQTVLLVDDRDADLEALEAVLDDGNLAFVRAHSGEDALRRLLEHDISLVLLDVKMPGMSGYEVARWMHRTEKTRRIPVLFITAGVEDEISTLHGYLSGALDYLRKPVNPPVLRAKVNRLLDLDRQRRGLEVAYRSLEAQQSFIGSILKAAGEGMMGLDLDGNIIFANPAASRYFGVSPEQLIGQKYSSFYVAHGDEAHDWRKTPFYRAWAERSEIRDEAEFMRAHDGSFPVSFCASPLPGPQPGVALVFQDVSERKAFEARLRQRAATDPLTGLGNRDTFKAALNVNLARAARRYRYIAVMFIDIDHFKQINDTFGHEAGDSLLRAVAQRLTQTVRVTDTVCRLGGDEFTVILDELDDAADAAYTADNILVALAAPVHVGGTEITLGASIGIATYPDCGHDAASLMQAADMAMYRAKSEGRNLYQFFTPDMNERVKARLELDQRLKHALGRNEFRLEYHPKIHLETGRIGGLEALLRWSPKTGENMSPSLFVPLLEESGMITAVGAWAIETACRQRYEWHQAGIVPKECRVSVNLSARQFLDEGLGRLLRQLITQYELTPAMIELELTESMLMQDTAQTDRVLSQLKDVGLKIAVDDFGTGHSSLAYFKRFDLDTLKIDPSFVRDIANDPKNAAIAESIVQLAHNLGMETVAENVETMEQLLVLRNMGCDFAQGYIFTRPLTPEAVLDFIHTWNTKTTARFVRHAQ